MKTGFLSLINPYILVISTIFCFVPFLLLWKKKLNREKAYLFVGIYWLVNGLSSLPECLGQSQNHQLLNDITLVYNLFDAPLVLLVFYFSATGAKRQQLLYLLISLLVFELVMVLWKGHNFDSSTIIVGTGDALILIYSIWGIAQYFQKIEHTPFENTMGLIYAGFIFEYTLFIIIYISNYLNYKKETVAVNAFVYYLSIISATILTSYGLWQHARPKYDKADEIRSATPIH